MITAERVNELHAEAIKRQGQAYAGSTKEGCVEGAIANAIMGAEYDADDGVGDSLQVAARLLRSLVQNHCYGDGNKRAGWAACHIDPVFTYPPSLGPVLLPGLSAIHLDGITSVLCGL